MPLKQTTIHYARGYGKMIELDIDVDGAVWTISAHTVRGMDSATVWRNSIVTGGITYTLSKSKNIETRCTLDGVIVNMHRLTEEIQDGQT